jgi:hypothetical protein
VQVSGMVSFDLWWNEVDSEDGQLYMAHHRSQRLRSHAGLGP